MPSPDWPWWWLSFADPDRPEGEQFLGVCIVQGTEPAMGFPRATDPIPRAWQLGLNPGGEVQFHRIPEDRQPPAEWTNRLLDRAECEQLDRVIRKRYGLPDG